jgi:hypothetical protein
VDLQLAYLAGPQNAAQVSAAEAAPENAQLAAQAAFAAQVQKREETIEKTTHAEGTRIRPDADRQSNGEGYTPYERRHPHGDASEDDPPLSGEGGHFIDVTA